MSVEQMRWMLKNKTKYRNCYKWINRVNRMSDNQVLAIYNRMLYAHEFLK